MKLREARLMWLEHVERMGEERQVKIIMNAKKECTRSVRGNHT